MDKPLTATEKMDETGMDELCSALAALNRHGLRITGRLDAMATLDRHGLRISGHFHAMDIIQVGLCIANLESRLAEIERERDEAQKKVTALTEGLQRVSDALARLDNIYRADTDLGDPPVEAPMWLREAQHRAAALLTPTAPAAGAGLCSARVNSAGNLCLMPAGHAGDHYPPTERAPQVIVRTDGTGPNPTPPQEET